ncbi:MAG TPA: DUF4386 domain-containing protein [Candidatus Polarisedimenticolaceae bacterium]|nr:DUF4386 domain-containing protein [Candidatus Polarisedimenticolaceae bacterium]
MATSFGEQVHPEGEGTRAGRPRWTPAQVARAAAILNIASGVGAGFSVSALSKIIVRDDVAHTAANLLRFESKFRFGMAAELCALGAFASAMLLVYALFRPVGDRCARAFVALTLMGATIQAADVLTDVAALIFVKGGPDLAALPVASAQALAYTCLRMHSFVYTVALIFMGFGSLCLALLVRRARFLPRLIGWIYPLDGLGILVSGFATLLVPALALRLRPIVPFGTAFVAEASLYFWLLIRGVDEHEWSEQSRAAE